MRVSFNGGRCKGEEVEGVGNLGGDDSNGRGRRQSGDRCDKLRGVFEGCSIAKRREVLSLSSLELDSDGESTVGLGRLFGPSGPGGPSLP